MRHGLMTITSMAAIAALTLAACSGPSADGPAGVSSAAAVPSPYPTDTFAIPDTAALAETIAIVDSESPDLPEGTTPTLTADFLRAVAGDDPDLLAIADSIAAAEAAALDGALGDLLAETGLSDLEPQSLGPTESAPAAGAARSGGRGASVRVPAEGAGEVRDFSKLAAINWALSELFSSYLPAGAQVAGTGSDSETKDGSTVKVGFDVDLNSSGASTFGLSTDVKVEPKGDRKGRGRAGVTFKATVDPCPAADGTVTLQFSASQSADISAGAKQATRSAEISGMAIGHVDDSAQLSSVDLEARHASSGTSAAGKGIYVDSSFAYTMSGLTSGGEFSVTPIKADTLNSESQEVDYAERNRVHKEGVNRAVHFALTYLRALQARWQDGKCVEVVAQSPGRVEPGAVTPIPVSVLHKPTGTALSAPVDATLSGPESIDPTRIEKAPGTITHTASGEPTSTASIELVSTSKRGIGRTTVTITVGSLTYRASGGGPRISVSGTVADLTKPFTLRGEGSGFAVVFEYTPTSPDGRSGTLVYSGQGGGATLEGTGTYTIAGEEGGELTMTAQNQGCATPGGCRSNTETITLTPVQ